jgi:hypothetical protein
MLSNSRHLDFFGVSKGEGINLYLRTVEIDHLDSLDNPPQKDIATSRPDKRLKSKPGNFFRREVIEDKEKLTYATSLIKKHPWRFFFGALRNWKKRSTYAFGLLAVLCILYFSLSASVFIKPIDRLRLPGDPFYWMFVSFGIIEGLTWLRARFLRACWSQ